MNKQLPYCPRYSTHSIQFILGLSLALSLSLTSINAFGFAKRPEASFSNTKAQPTLANTTTTAPATPVITQVCPSLQSLHRNADLIWKSGQPGAEQWTSYTKSFVDEVDSFIGAQWVGVTVGKIFCLYKGKLADRFPVSLERETLIDSPSGGRWGVEKDGHKNCRAIRQSDCAFQLPAPAPKRDIYQELESFKKPH